MNRSEAQAGEVEIPGTATALLRLIRDAEQITRAELMTRSGLGRTAIGQRIDTLLDAGLIYEAGEASSTGGRPPTLLAFNAAAGVLLIADLGATHCRLAVTDMAVRELAASGDDLDIALGPDVVLQRVRQELSRLLGVAGRSANDVRGIGVGLPGPVAYSTGTAVNPPIMPGWDGVAVPDAFADYGVPVLVDNDVNCMAVGEHRAALSDDEEMLFVKVGTGIGCGIIIDGQVHRGAQGGAGDIGHIRVSAHDDVVCRCGNNACLEAVAGGAAMASRLAALGLDVTDSRGVVELVQGGHAGATRMIREAGRLLGEVLASLVNFFNPSTIAVGGDIALAHEPLLAGIREVVYRRSLPLATRHLRIVHSELGDRAGTFGAAAMVADHLLADTAAGLNGTPGRGALRFSS